MSRVDGAARVLEAAAALGAAHGAGALSIQAIANAAGVSKALVLYHHADRPQLLRALHTHVGTASARRIAGAAAAADPSDPLESWRVLARDESQRGELALFAALTHDVAVNDPEPSQRARVAAVARAREAAATELVEAMFGALELTARVEPALIGRALLRHLDGLAVAQSSPSTRGETRMLDADLDTFALALLGLGR